MFKNEFSQKKKKSTGIIKSKINEYKEVFDIFDKDKNGIISINDIIKIINIFSYPISKRNIERMIKEINVSGDGKFDFNNFVNLMEKQNDYINENNEEMILESFRDEYLGKKRRKEELDDNISGYKEKLNNIVEIPEKEDNIINIEESIDNIIPDINMNKNKNNYEKKDVEVKNKNINIIDNLNSKKSVIQIKKKNTYGINYYKDEDSKSKNTDRIKLKERKNKERRKQSKKNIDPLSNIVIYKNNLSKELIQLIEAKNKFNEFQTKNEYNIKTPFRDNINTIPIKQPISNFSNKYIVDFDFNNISNIKPGDNSFASDLSLDFFNKPINLPNKNFKIDKTKNFKVNKNINNIINNVPEKSLKCESEIDNKGLNEKQNINDNNFQKSKKKINNDCLKDNIIIIYKKNDEEFSLNNENSFADNKMGMMEENNIQKIDKNIPEFETKYLNKNIQILNTFELIYKKNRKREKLIKKAIEIPYLIIINKNCLDLDIFKNNHPQENLNDKGNKTNTQNNIKNDKKSPNFNGKNDLNIIEKNESRQDFLNNIENNTKNITKIDKHKKQKSIIKKKKKMKEVEKEEKESNNSKIEEEDNKLSSIAKIFTNSSLENESKEIKNVILQEKTFIDDDNGKHNYGKNKNKIKRDNIKEEEKDLTTIDVLNGFNYLYQQKMQ